MSAPSLLRVFSLLLLLPFVFTSVGCEDDPVAPGIQPEIINQVDNFQFQTTAVQNYSGDLDYNWTTTGTVAKTNHSCSITAGTATLILLDANGTQVYSRDLAVDGTFFSDAGVTGRWKIRVRLAACSGTLNFRVDKES